MAEASAHSYPPLALVLGTCQVASPDGPCWSAFVAWTVAVTLQPVWAPTVGALRTEPRFFQNVDLTR